MEHPEVSSFEDPALKDALRRSYCAQKAPASLRDKICQCLALADVQAPESEKTSAHEANGHSLKIAPASVGGTMRITPPSTRSMTLPSLLPGLSIAAAMIIAIGSVALILNTSSQAIPLNFEAAAIARHDECCQAPNHVNLNVPASSFGKMGQYLRQELAHPVLAADMTTDGWTFGGASICPVNGIPAAHLIFRKGSVTLSVLSLPASAVPSLANQQTYEGTTPDGHVVVALAKDGAVYCLVGHCPKGQLTCSDLDRLLADHQSQATVTAMPGPPITLAGIPREP